MSTDLNRHVSEPIDAMGEMKETKTDASGSSSALPEDLNRQASAAANPMWNSTKDLDRQVSELVADLTNPNVPSTDALKSRVHNALEAMAQWHQELAELQRKANEGKSQVKSHSGDERVESTRSMGPGTGEEGSASRAPGEDSREQGGQSGLRTQTGKVQEGK